jgi:hypothetical protein
MGRERPLPTQAEVKYYGAMAISKRGLNVFIVVLFAILLFALNPSSEDFQAWRSASARDEATSGNMEGITGVMKKGSGALAGAINGLAASGYKRTDFFLFSSYSLGSESYLGVARLFFRLK